MLPQKHKDASKFKYNSGFFITTNVYPDFGPGDDSDAIRKRLDIFTTKPLKRKNASVTGDYISFGNISVSKKYHNLERL